MINPWEFDSVYAGFPRGSKVVSVGDSDSQGTVAWVDRSQHTNSGRVMVRWHSTNIVADCHPSQIKVIVDE